MKWLKDQFGFGPRFAWETIRLMKRTLDEEVRSDRDA